MIEIKNISQESLEVIESVDKTVKGCRVLMSPFNNMTIKPGETIVLLGYEPGISRVIRPVNKPHIPRNGFDLAFQPLDELDNG